MFPGRRLRRRALVLLSMITLIREIAVVRPGTISAGLAEMTAQLLGQVIINGAGVREFFRNAKLGQGLDDLFRWNFQLSRQHIDPDFTHIRNYAILSPFPSFNAAALGNRRQ